MRFKIGFSGTHGTGKTTLVYGVAAALQATGYNAAIINESARETQFEVNDKTSHFAQTDIVARQLRNELDAERRPVDFIITDRTTLDAIAYTMLAEKEGRIGRGWAKATMPLAMKWLSTYDMIFYVKPAFDLDEKVKEEKAREWAMAEKIANAPLLGIMADTERWTTYRSMKQIDDLLYNLYIGDVDITVIDSNCALADRVTYVLKILHKAIG